MNSIGGAPLFFLEFGDIVLYFTPYTIALFLLVRVLDDFVFVPLTIGRSLQMHPLVSVLLLFIGGAVAGVLGLIIVLPLAGVVMIIVGRAKPSSEHVAQVVPVLGPTYAGVEGRW